MRAITAAAFLISGGLYIDTIVIVPEAMAQDLQLTPLLPAPSGPLSRRVMNRYGHVAGNTRYGDQQFGMFFWSPATGILPLSTQQTSVGQMNDRDQIATAVITQNPFTSRAVVLQPGVPPRDITAELNLRGNYNSAEGINNAGQIIGTGSGLTRPQDSYIYTLGQPLRWIPPLNTYTTVPLKDISESGQVAAMAFLSDIGPVARLIEPSGAVHVIDTLAGDTLSSAEAINNEGQIVGTSEGRIGGRAYVWSARTGMIDIGRLTGLRFSNASQINDYGQVSGNAGAQRFPPERAFVYTPGLLLLWLSNLPLGGWVPVTADAINEYGEVSGLMRRAGSSELMTYRLGLGCDLTITPSHVTLPAAGGSARIDIGAGPYCPWIAKPSASWIQPLQGAAQGTGVVVFAAGANPEGIPRTAVINVLGRSIQILQKGSAPVPLYADVPANSPILDYISVVKARGVMADCGSVFAPQFCPDYGVTKAEMAEMIVRAKFGPPNFTYPQPPYFTDVPPGHPQFKYIQKLAELGAAEATFGSLFFPDAYPLRSLGARMILRAKYGAILPTTRVAPFVDLFSDFAVEAHKMHDLGITAGCTINQFCPGNAVTRGQMAVFLTRAFLTPLGVWER